MSVSLVTTPTRSRGDSDTWAPGDPVFWAAKRATIADYHTGNTAYAAFIGFYVVCSAVTLAVYRNEGRAANA